MHSNIGNYFVDKKVVLKCNVIIIIIIINTLLDHFKCEENPFMFSFKVRHVQMPGTCDLV